MTEADIKQNKEFIVAYLTGDQHGSVDLVAEAVESLLGVGLGALDSEVF